MTDTARRLRLLVIEDRERELFSRIQNRQDLDAAQCELLQLQRERDELPPLPTSAPCAYCQLLVLSTAFCCERCGWKVSA